MTDQEKLQKLDCKLKAQHPEMKDDEYAAFRLEWIRKRKKLSLWVSVCGLAVIFAAFALAKVSLAAFWCLAIGGFAICMTSMALSQYLPGIPRNTRDDTPEEYLTSDRIARDCAQKRKQSAGWFFLFFTIVIFACVVGAQGLDYALETWWGYVPVMALSVFFIIRARIKSRELEAEMLRGDFHLICSPLIDKEEEEDTSGDTTTYNWYLYFNCHDEHGRYKLKTSKNQFDFAESGKDYYVVLRKNRKGEMEPVKAYRAEKNPLDVQLKEMLKRDTALTGKPLTMQEELENAKAQFAAYREEIQLSPEEAEAMLPQINSWTKKGMTLLGIAAAVTIICIVLGFIMMFRIKALENSASWLSEPRDVAWYWKLLLTTVYLAGCGVPYWRNFRYAKKIDAYQYRMQIPFSSSRYGCLRAFLLCIVWFGFIAMFTLLLCIWRVLT